MAFGKVTIFGENVFPFTFHTKSNRLRHKQMNNVTMNGKAQWKTKRPKYMPTLNCALHNLDLATRIHFHFHYPLKSHSPVDVVFSQIFSCATVFQCITFSAVVVLCASTSWNAASNYFIHCVVDKPSYSLSRFVLMCAIGFSHIFNFSHLLSYIFRRLIARNAIHLNCRCFP